MHRGAGVVVRYRRKVGLEITPDPLPEAVAFIRSDQYPLVRAGVLALFIVAGIRRKDGSDGLKAFRDFFRDVYHLPNDDLRQPIDWQGAAKIAVVDYKIVHAVATQNERPAWKRRDFFGDKFARPERE